MEALLKVPEAAKLLNVSEKSVWAWIYSRQLGSIRLQRSVRIRREEIERFIEAGEVPAGKPGTIKATHSENVAK